jgi:hypothetical protein
MPAEKALRPAAAVARGPSAVVARRLTALARPPAAVRLTGLHRLRT